MKHTGLFGVVIVALAGAACGPPQGGEPTVPGVEGHTDAPPVCQAARDPLNPMIVEWPAMNRAALDSASRRGLVVVSYAGCVLKVLTNCTAEGAYEASPATPAGDTLTIEDESKLYAELPLSVASLKGELAEGKRLELSYVATGQRVASKGPAALSGDCRGATHWVKTMTVGAYSLDAVATTRASGGVEVAGVQGGVGDQAKRARKGNSGDVEGCRAGTASGEACNAILQIGLAELAPAGMASAGFGAGLRPTASVPVVEALREFGGPAGNLADVDVALLELLQDAKRADKNAKLGAEAKAAVWEKLAGYEGENPYRASAQERREAWRKVAWAEAARREQEAKAYEQWKKDSAKLNRLLAFDDDVVSARQKQAYKDEFARVYAPWQAVIVTMKTRDAQAQAQAERQRAIGAMVEIPGRGYWMDVTEVTLAAYELCVREKGCTQPGTGGECNWGTSRKIHPINCVDWNQAIAFCRWAGKRLPTEQEWQFAAQGPDGRLYPWGNDDPRVQLCWRTSGTCPAGSYASSDSPFGLKDMAGNVWEWTSSKYDAKTRVFRGGSWDNHTPSYVGAAFRFGDDPTYRIYSLGFRCAR